MKKRGFTLIELLVVIAIISLLLAVIVPSLRKAKEQACGVMCQSNLHQWHVCFKTYLQENGDKFAAFKTANSASGTWSWQDWIDSLYPYFQDGDVFKCPSAEKTDFIAGVNIDLGSRGYFGRIDSCWRAKWISSSGLAGANGEAIIDGSYGYNYWVSNMTQEDMLKMGMSVPINSFWRSDLSVGTSKVPLFMDNIWAGTFVVDANRPRPEKDVYSMGGADRVAIPRHNRRFNQMAFLDGHFEKISMKDIWGLNWHSGYDRSVVNSISWPQWIADLEPN